VRRLPLCGIKTRDENMKYLVTGVVLLMSFAVFGQQMNWEDWEKEAQSNIRLLPKYGNVEKTEKQKESDKEFIETILKQDSTHRKGSDHLIDLGFKYLYHDIKTAMYRFNQAYLLDSTNTDIYWGFGAVYMTLGNYQKAKEQYEEGLSIEPHNTHLLTDYGTYFMAQFYGLKPVDEENAYNNLDSAIIYMTKSYELDSKDQNTTFKLSILYWNKGECGNAWKYYDKCMELGGQPITKEYTRDLKLKCNREKLDCSNVKVGKYRIEDELSGVTLIERTKKYQIEENSKYGYKLKLEVNWVDNCTYTLKPVKDLLNPKNPLPEMILTCKITEVYEDYYMQTSTSDTNSEILVKKVMMTK
jgi:tetratricopeptide (TPR) repeat protein